MQRVFFYVPNLIDYVRIILNLASFYNMTHRPFLTVALYFSGGILLDVADGVSARYFKQCSKYGELLDFLLDRCGRLGMMMALCAFYPRHLFLLQLLVCLEVTGSFANLYRCALVLHPDDVSSKTRSQDPWLVRIFFEEPITTLVITGQDICVAMLYLLHFSPGPVVSLGGTSHSLWLLMARIFSPFLIYRQVIVCGLLLLLSLGDLAELHHQQATSDRKSK